MFKPIDIHRHVSDIRSVLNTSFQTVMDEFRFTREMVPENPAFVDEAAILDYAENKMMPFYGYWGSNPIRNNSRCSTLRAEPGFIWSTCAGIFKQKGWTYPGNSYSLHGNGIRVQNSIVAI